MLTRRIGRTCFSWLATALLAVPSLAFALTLPATTRTLTPREEVEWSIDEAQVVTFARVITARKDEWRGPSGSMQSGWRVELEPMTYFKGGLDGDRLEALIPKLTLAPGIDPVAEVAGRETRAAVFYLRSLRGEWYAGFGTAQKPAHFEQTRWKSVADSMTAIVEGMSLESTLARADVVAIGHVEGSSGPPVALVLDTVLAGKAKTRPLKLRTLFGKFPRGQQLVCLKRGKDGIYEPIPFTRIVITSSDFQENPPILRDQRLNEVKEILARVRPNSTPKNR